MRRLSAVLLAACLSSSAYAGSWSWNLGYHNPPGAEPVGLNFMYLWSQVAFEVGIGAIRATHEDEETDKEAANDLHLGGGANLKYLFLQGIFRPYLQVGTGIGASGGSSGVGAGGGQSLYFGGGIFLMGSPFYLYGSINFAGEASFYQGGLGFKI